VAAAGLWHHQREWQQSAAAALRHRASAASLGISLVALGARGAQRRQRRWHLSIIAHRRQHQPQARQQHGGMASALSMALSHRGGADLAKYRPSAIAAHQLAAASGGALAASAGNGGWRLQRRRQSSRQAAASAGGLAAASSMAAEAAKARWLSVSAKTTSAAAALSMAAASASLGARQRGGVSAAKRHRSRGSISAHQRQHRALGWQHRRYRWRWQRSSISGGVSAAAWMKTSAIAGSSERKASMAAA